MMFAADPTLDALLRGAILAAIGLAWVVLLVRIIGLRSFSKMTSFDFVMTVGMGSLVATASQAKDWNGMGQAMAAMAALFVVQWIAAKLRRKSDMAEKLMHNEPALLMRDGRFLDEALDATRVAKSDIYAKLREANVLSFSEVRAVVLETTGDISVLHGERLDPELLQQVRNA